MIVHYGYGLLNNLINNLPFELHIPGGYQFCGPGTKLQKRLARGNRGINPLDSACREHDIAYSINRNNIEERNIADKILAEKAWNRVLAKDSSLGEKTAAYAVANIMKTKSKLGMGMKKKKKMGKKQKNLTFRKIMDAAKKSMKKNTNNGKTVIKSALAGAKKFIKKHGGKNKIQNFRILPLPLKTGGVLPLIPIFAGLSAIGALTNGISGITKAINEAKSTKKQLDEATRHNRMMESIAIGKGLYLKPYKIGAGMTLKLFNENFKKGEKKKTLKF